MKRTVLGPALATLLCAGSAMAEAQLEVTLPYMVQLLNGEPVSANLLDKKRVFPLNEGNHQVVIQFEGNYSTRDNIKLVTAEPVVINFTASNNQQLYLDYKRPYQEIDAKQFVKEQHVVLRDRATGKNVATEQFVMPKVGGFQLTRDFQQELVKLGKAFNQPELTAVANPVTETSSHLPSSVTDVDNPLQQLQYWYNKADAQSRKAFQIWVIQQQ